MPKKLQAKKLAISFAVWSALIMFFLWILDKLGVYVQAAQQMANWHMFYNQTLTGLVGGMIEAALVSVLSVYTFVWIYNWLGNKL